MKNLTNHVQENLVNEGAKDEMRINDIIKKANGNGAKEIQLASNMADKITQKPKAFDRYKAALDILGPDHQVTQIFSKRAIALGHDISNVKQEAIKLPEPPKERVHKLATDAGGAALAIGNLASSLYRRQGKGTPILPCGALTFSSGKNKYWNVYENSRYGGSTLEIYKSGDNKFYIVCTSGDKPMLKIGERNYFCHDQNGRSLFEGVMVDWIVVDESELSLLEIKRKYGKNSMSFYVYK